MKFDLHCHTQEGSLDGKLPIAEYIRLLQEKGYDGMLVTDHNSYKGYRAYRDILKEKLHNFVVLKGIEYDTIDAGHILVIMPEQVKLKLLECRGLPVRIFTGYCSQTRRHSWSCPSLRRTSLELYTD